jgi:hypothetical protein
MVRNIMACLVAALLLAAPLRAQNNDLPVSDTINYDDPVSDTLTARAFWDWWFLQAAQGDRIVATMTGYDGLEPLLGILDEMGTLVARSEDGAPNGTITLEYTAPQTGEYTIVATRVGNENGTSLGPYHLLVRRANEDAARVNPYQEVTFRCQNFEVANAATIEFAEDADQAMSYLIAVYGLDGFRPVIRVHLAALDFTDCSRDSQHMGGSSFTLPGEEPVTLVENFADSAAQLFIPNAAPTGAVTLTIGSEDGTPGRYIAVVHGFSIGAADQDTIRLARGPLASLRPLTVYMIADARSRLDPALEFAYDDAPGPVCDDAGRRGCEGVPSPLGLHVFLAEQAVEIKAGPFDAGLVLPPALPQVYEIDLGSFNGNTSGAYSLVLLGELPPRP